MMLLFAGDLATATGLTEEGRAVIDATGSQFAPYAAMGLAALRGQAGRGVRPDRGHRQRCHPARRRHRDVRR